MDVPELSFRGKLILYIRGLLERRRAKRYWEPILSDMTEEERQELKRIMSPKKGDNLYNVTLLDLAPMIMSRITEPTLRNLFPELFGILSGDPVLASICVLPYLKPALRFVPQEYVARLRLVPIATLPKMEFPTAYYNRLETTGKPGKQYIKVPFGFFFALAAIAQAGFGLYDAASRLEQVGLDNEKAWTCFSIASEAFHDLVSRLGALTPALSTNVRRIMGEPQGFSALQMVHVMHTMGIFMVLHEFGHVVFNHRSPSKKEAELDASEVERLRKQELEADKFAIDALLRRKVNSSIAWDDVRELHILCVCILLITINKYFEVYDLKPKGYYPTIRERCAAILDNFGAPASLREKIDMFHFLLFARRLV